MIPRLLTKTIKGNFVIIDSTFPQGEPFGFRNIEINEYLSRIDGAEAYSMSVTEPWGDAWFPWSYGVDEATYKKNYEGYIDHYPENANKIHHIDPGKKYRFKLAYSYFLAETYILLPFYEKNNIPFVFMLYPGGTFGLDNEASDAMLRRIMTSSCFRGVIVSQDITKQYLLKKSFCSPDKISYVYGGFVQFDKSEVKPKLLYKKDKKTFDVCFVAAKYTEQGIDKGFDLFIEAAKELVQKAEDIRFHVVGNFTETDVPALELEGKITFYGYQKKDFFLDFFSKMDILLSPNRPSKLYKGNFDGFPIGIDAGFCGTAMFVTDELRMNKHFTNNEDIVIVPLDATKIAERVSVYYNDLERLYRLSRRGMKISQGLFSIELQTMSRLDIFNKIYIQEYKERLT